MDENEKIELTCENETMEDELMAALAVMCRRPTPEGLKRDLFALYKAIKRKTLSLVAKTGVLMVSLFTFFLWLIILNWRISLKILAEAWFGVVSVLDIFLTIWNVKPQFATGFVLVLWMVLLLSGIMLTLVSKRASVFK